MFLYFCDDMCCEWAEAVHVKCDVQPGRVQCVMSNVRCSAVLQCPQCHVVLWGLCMCHSSIKNSISRSWLLSSDKSSLLLHDK